MRERAQASVETAALTAVALALAIVLGLAVVRLGPALASTIAGAVSGVFESGRPTAPGLDGLERDLLAAATAGGASAPTLLDLRTQLRARLGDDAGDAAFDDAVRPIVERLAHAASVAGAARAITVVDRSVEDSWLEHRLNPGLMRRALKFAFAESPIGAADAVAVDAGMLDPRTRISPGNAAGDLVVQIRGRRSGAIVVRRQADGGLAIISTLAGTG
jgi:hypothetical protein